jgi:hypothetical protein
LVAYIKLAQTASTAVSPRQGKHELHPVEGPHVGPSWQWSGWRFSVSAPIEEVLEDRSRLPVLIVLSLGRSRQVFLLLLLLLLLLL